MSENRTKERRHTPKIKSSEGASEKEIDQAINTSPTTSKISHDEFAPFKSYKIQLPSPKPVKLENISIAFSARVGTSSQTTTCYHFVNQGASIYLPKKLLTKDQQNEVSIWIQNKISENKQALDQKTQKSLESRKALQARIPDVEKEQQRHTNYSTRTLQAKSTPSKRTRDDNPIGTPDDTHSMYKYTVPLQQTSKDVQKETAQVDDEGPPQTDPMVPASKRPKSTVRYISAKTRTY
jgi:hypothetical protein